MTELFRVHRMKDNKANAQFWQFLKFESIQNSRIKLLCNFERFQIKNNKEGNITYFLYHHIFISLQLFFFTNLEAVLYVKMLKSIDK